MKIRKTKRVAIISEFICNFGGIEKCILILAKELIKKKIECDIYVGFYDREKTYPEFESMNIRLISNKRMPFGFNSFYLRNKFRKLKLKNYDGYIIFGFHSIAAAKNNHPNVWWSTGPLMYLYGVGGETPKEILLKLSGKNIIKMSLGWMGLKLLRFIDKKEIKNVDKVLIVGPKAQKNLLRAYPGIKSNIVFAPVYLENYKYLSDGRYYLSVSRPAGNVDKIIEAFKKMPDKKLVVVGKDDSLNNLIKLASGHKNINIRGFVQENKLQTIVGKSIAMISMYGRNIDFTMNQIESIAAGKPIIAADDINQNIVETAIGIKIDEIEPEKIKKAVELMSLAKAKKLRKNCEKESKKFSVTNFVDNIMKALS